MSVRPDKDALAQFHPAVRAWFESAFGAPTRPQALGWPVIAHGDSTLVLAPTGSGKTLAASRPAPAPDDLPAHFVTNYSEAARSTLDHFGLTVGIL